MATTPPPGARPRPAAGPGAVPPPGPAPHVPFSLLNDEPVADPAADLLGAGRAARQLAGLLAASHDSTPFTLAVDAGWGMGKSSLMRLVDAELAELTRRAGTPDVHTVWYNAWTSTGADALEGLIKSVLMRFDRRVLRRGLQRVSERRAVLRALRALTTVAAGPLGVSGLVDELWKSLSVNSQARNEMRGALGDLVQEWADGGDFRPRRLLVVFIDDLDRCSEETVLAVCEAVKVYLDVPGLAFVVGCDRSALGPNGLLRDLSPAGSAFMEKIFQTSYRIPAADGQGVKDYIRWCARTAGVEPLLDDAMVELLVQRTGRNPRRIKRLMNGFVLEATLNPVWRDFGPGAVIRTLLLQYFYPDFYRMMTGPSGTVDGDVVAEFRTYREVRRTLLAAPGGAGAGELAAARAFLASYDLVAPAGTGPEGAEVLASLERQLPNEFPDLVINPGFTSLVDELAGRPDAERLLLRLREGPLLSGQTPTRMSREWEPLWQGLQNVPPDGFDTGFGPPLAWPPGGLQVGPTAQQSAPYGMPAPYTSPVYAPPGYATPPYTSPQQQPFGMPPDAYGRQLPEPLPDTDPQDADFDLVPPAGTGSPAGIGTPAGLGTPYPDPYPGTSYSALPGYASAALEVLWVDDQPDRKAEVRTVLASLGMRVRHVDGSEAAAAELRARSFGLLVSDISRGRQHHAGFEMAERFAADGLYDGPVIFYTIRQSPDREERAARLGAAITNKEDELRDLLLAVVQQTAPAPVPWSAPQPVRAPFQRTRPPAGPGAGPEPGTLDLSVVWVDDEADSQYWLGAELRRGGAEVFITGDEQEAIDRLSTHGADLLLSDVSRYGDEEAGFAFARRLRQERHYLGPLGFFTSQVTATRKERAREVAALGVTSRESVVLSWVEAVQGTRRAGGREGGAAPEDGASAPEDGAAYAGAPDGDSPGSPDRGSPDGEAPVAG
ncbi:P-loop NTPase fold protein [Streptomyces sp. NPDC101393]|uniref:P-loop NTPase fold protein n=1 Tax=Streptomyces sp. NPDC101393 TaxID=3366141 RepID=UPI003803B9AE